ncbi:flagellar type III secretion system pore protein FliP [Ignavibacteria bacterium]|nr:flagellar type III secretion system pore protein FliP [Bacteroidota bacterium]MCZ2131576.1 flagellar type III secretion system pore protein FliP [Bacteroidota bacterium]
MKKYAAAIRITFALLTCLILIFTAVAAYSQSPAAPISLPKISLGVEQAQSPKDAVLTLQIVAVMTILTLAPSILIMATCFTRIIVVFHFLKQALGTQTQPPSQLLTGLALFLTFYVMQPSLNQANSTGLQPYLRDEITQEQAVTNIVKPFREFMLRHTREEDLALFVKLSGAEKPAALDDVSTLTVIPAYSLSELRMAFQIGFIIFIPFLVLDMVISSILMSLGMMMLPPQLISMPIKVLLFVMVDGWNLIVKSLMESIVSPGG